MAVSKYYRYQQHHETEFSIALHLNEYDVVKTTPKGVWINLTDEFDDVAQQKFVLNNANKKWACPTPELALESFIARKNRQIKILRAQVDTATEALNVALRIKEKNETATEPVGSMGLLESGPEDLPRPPGPVCPVPGPSLRPVSDRKPETPGSGGGQKE